MTLGLAKQHERLAKALAETGINEKQQPLEYRAQAQVLVHLHTITSTWLPCLISSAFASYPVHPHIGMASDMASAGYACCRASCKSQSLPQGVT